MKDEACVSPRRFIVATFLLLIGCGDRGMSFYPLDQSERWTYQLSRSSILGTDGQGRLTVSNMSKRELVGKYVTPQKVETRELTFFTFVGEDSDGIFELAEQSPNATDPKIEKPPKYFLRKPFKEGTRWNFTSVTQALSARLSITLQAVIESADDTVTVPIGTFEACLKVVAKGEQTYYTAGLGGSGKIHVEDTSWYCPGVGLAKSIRKEISNGKMAESGEIAIQLESRGNNGP